MGMYKAYRQPYMELPALDAFFHELNKLAEAEKLLAAVWKELKCYDNSAYPETAFKRPCEAYWKQGLTEETWKRISGLRGLIEAPSHLHSRPISFEEYGYLKIKLALLEDLWEELGPYIPTDSHKSNPRSSRHERQVPWTGMIRTKTWMGIQRFFKFNDSE